MLSRIPLITGLVTSLALLAQAPAQASNRDAAIAGAVVGAVIGGVIVSQSRPAQVYTPPPPAYYPPPPVAYYPPRRAVCSRRLSAALGHTRARALCAALRGAPRRNAAQRARAER